MRLDPAPAAQAVYRFVSLFRENKFKHRLYWPEIAEIAPDTSGHDGEVCKAYGQDIVAEMKEEIFQVLLRLLLVGIQPVTQAATAHELSQQGNIAIVGSIATPGKESIGNCCKWGDQQQRTRAAVCKINKEDNEDGGSRGNDHDTPPLLEETPAGQRAFDQDSMTND